MQRRSSFLIAGVAAVSLTLGAYVPFSSAQRDIGLLEPDEARAQLEAATRSSEQAEARAAQLESEAQAADDAADKTAREAAALAAQIQQSEANIAAAKARFSLAQTDRMALAARLADRQEPLVRLTGSLQTTARRPLTLSALQPGSLKDLVYVRAVLDSAVPQIRERTASLRFELEEGKRLEREAARAVDALRRSEQQLQVRREELAALEASQRLMSREARSNALREGERALALAEEARDLDGLMGELGAAARLREELAALPGPVLRPAGLSTSASASIPDVPDPTPSASPTRASRPPAGFQLPVQGRTLAGFGEQRESGIRTSGIELVPAPGAQVIAPASGRIAFAGPYRGYGRIVIIEHSGGWTSLVTGLERTSAAVGDEVIGGSPLGVAAGEDPVIAIELRRDGEPVNPLEFIG